MTDTIEPMAAQIDQQRLAEELVARAREEGVQLVGRDGLLSGLTKSVVETALEEELSDHLGYDTHDPVGRGLAGEQAPDASADAAAALVVDVDATLVTSHSEKEQAAATFKRGYRHHPVCSFVDHGPNGSGEPLAVLLRPGNAAPTPPPTTSPSSATRWRSSPSTGWLSASSTTSSRS